MIAKNPKPNALQRFVKPKKQSKFFIKALPAKEELFSDPSWRQTSLDWKQVEAAWRKHYAN